MRAALVRVGIDQAYGAWNTPVDPDTGEFVCVPIPEGAKTPVWPRARDDVGHYQVNGSKSRARQRD